MCKNFNQPMYRFVARDIELFAAADAVLFVQFWIVDRELFFCWLLVVICVSMHLVIGLVDYFVCFQPWIDQIFSTNISYAHNFAHSFGFDCGYDYYFYCVVCVHVRAVCAYIDILDLNTQNGIYITWLFVASVTIAAVMYFWINNRPYLYVLYIYINTRIRMSIQTTKYRQ